MKHILGFSSSSSPIFLESLYFILLRILSNTTSLWRIKSIPAQHINKLKRAKFNSSRTYRPIAYLNWNWDNTWRWWCQISNWRCTKPNFPFLNMQGKKWEIRITDPPNYTIPNNGKNEKSQAKWFVKHQRESPSIVVVLITNLSQSNLNSSRNRQMERIISPRTSTKTKATETKELFFMK